MSKKRSKKLSFKDTRLLEGLCDKMSDIKNNLARLETELEAPDLYTRNYKELIKITARYDALRNEQAHAEEQWLELEIKRIDILSSCS
jgi:ATP-binding cassette subfamily F protein uup